MIKLTAKEIINRGAETEREQTLIEYLLDCTRELESLESEIASEQDSYNDISEELEEANEEIEELEEKIEELEEKIEELEEKIEELEEKIDKLEALLAENGIEYTL